MKKKPRLVHLFKKSAMIGPKENFLDNWEQNEQHGRIHCRRKLDI